MELMAWFDEYQKMHQPGDTWTLEADQAVRTAAALYGKTGDASARAYVIRWADSIAAGRGTAACWRPLFFAMQETGEARYHDAIEAIMAALGRDLPEQTPYAELPFRMAYEMKLGGMEKVGLCAAAFRREHTAGWDVKQGLFHGSREETALYLTALMDAIETCSDQLYEHWRALVDLYREVLKGALAGESGLTVIEALLRGVKRGIIDPERYLPIAKAKLSAMQAEGCDMAAAMLMMEGGAL